MAAKQRCPKCNQPIEPGAAQCPHCNAPLVQVCPTCGTARPWYVSRCVRCDAVASDAIIFADLFRSVPDRPLQDRYLLKQILATGRVTTIYRAEDRQAGTPCAIKEISAVALFRADERREAEQQLQRAVERWQKATHPGLAAVRAWFVERDRYYVVFDYAPGWSGERILAERLRITPELARNWGAQLADLLAALHAIQPPLYAPFLAPGHIVVSPQGEVKLVGLGLGRFFNPSAYGPLGGTRGYYAPELESQDASPASDSFGLGRLLYALLIGQALDKGLLRQMTLKQAMPGISAQLVAAIAKAAHRDPAQRYDRLGELRDDLWEPVRGPLAPVAEWYQQTNLAAPEAPPAPLARSSAAHAERVTARPSPGMADLGFAPDPRFGPRPSEREPVVAAPALQGKAKLSVYPHEFSLTDLKPEEARRVVLRVRNTGDAELTGAVQSHVEWLRAPKSPFVIPPGKEGQVICTVRAEAVPAGRRVEPQALSVETNVGRQWIGITAEVAIGPILRVEPMVLDFGQLAAEPERIIAIEISNAGRQPLSGQAISQAPWLRVAPAAFKCGPGAAITLRATVRVAQLPRGAQLLDEAILVDSDGGQARISVRAWRPVPELDLGASHIDLGELRAGAIAERLLYISNTGDGALEGTARSLASWLAVSPTFFRCEPGEMVQCTLTADTAGLGNGLVELPQAVRVATNGGAATLSLRAIVSAPLLVVETTALDLGAIAVGQSARRELAVRNDGSAPLEAAIEVVAPWLSPERATLAIAPHGRAVMGIALREEAAARGQRLQAAPALRVRSGAQVVEVAASVVVLQPALRVEPEALDFGYIPRTEPVHRSLLIANDGTAPLGWTAQTDVQWLELAPMAGVCAPGQAVTLTLTAYALALDAGAEVAVGTLAITSDGGRTKVPLRVGLAAPVLATDTLLLDLGVSANLQPVSGSLRILNHGLGLLKGTVRADRLWLVPERVTFECDTGRSVELRVRTDMDEFPSGASSASAWLVIESNGGQAQVEVALSVALLPEIVVPEALILATSPDGGAPQGRLALTNKGLAPARVSLEGNRGAIVISRQAVDIKPDKSVRVAISWEERAPEQQVEASIRVSYGDRSVNVPVVIQQTEAQSATPTMS